MNWGVHLCMAVTALFMLGYGIHLCQLTWYNTMLNSPTCASHRVYADPPRGLLTFLFLSRSLDRRPAEDRRHVQRPAASSNRWTSSFFLLFHVLCALAVPVAYALASRP